VAAGAVAPILSQAQAVVLAVAVQGTELEEQELQIKVLLVPVV
jgi:hypothetical protein